MQPCYIVLVDILLIDDIYNEYEKRNSDSNKERNKELHLSQMAICGFKYRYELDTNKQIPFNWKFELGNAFEWSFVSKLEKIHKISKQLEIKTTLKMDGKELLLTGHVDAYDYDLDMPLELKLTTSDFVKDIYRRQLTAYMILLKKQHGKLIIYNLIHNKINEYDEILEQNDVELLEKNLNAFSHKKYIPGIENYLCKFCDNPDCVMSKKKGIVNVGGD